MARRCRYVEWGSLLIHIDKERMKMKENKIGNVFGRAASERSDGGAVLARFQALMKIFDQMLRELPLLHQNRSRSR